MTSENVQQHVRAALAAATAVEEQRLAQTIAASAANRAKDELLMGPVVAALEALALEVADVTGVRVTASVWSAGVRLDDKSGSSRRLQINLSSDRSDFAVDESSYYNFGNCETFEKVHRGKTAEQALEMVLHAVGAHVARQRADVAK